MIIFFKLILITAVFFFFGWQVVRRILKQNELYVVIPVAWSVGFVSYVSIVNLLGYFIKIQTAFWLALLIMLIAGGFFYFLKKEKIFLGIDKKIFFWLVGITVAFGLFFGLIFFANFSYDETWHASYISTIAHGNFPVKALLNPAQYAQYHYSFDLLAASFQHILITSSKIGSDIGMLICLLPVYWLAFMVIFKLTKDYKSAFLSGWLLFFGGGLRYLAVLGDINWHHGYYIWDYLKQAKDLFVAVEPFKSGYFHPYSIETFGPGLFHRPTLFAWPLILMIFWLINLEKEKPDNYIYKICLAVLFGFLAQTSETIFVVLAFTWGVWKIALFIHNRNFMNESRKLFSSVVLVGIASSLMAIFQGGVITDMIIHTVKNSAIASSSLSIRLIPGLISFSGFYPFTKMYSWVFIITEWGIPLLLLPCVVIFFFKKGGIWIFFTTLTLISFLFSFFVNYVTSPREMVRISEFGYIVLGILLGVYFIYLLDKKKISKTVVIVTIVLMSISPFFFNLRLLPAGVRLAQADYDKKEYQIARVMSERMKKDDIILTAAPFVVGDLWGALSYYLPADQSLFGREDDYIKQFISSAGIKEIKEHKIQYIYFNPSFSEIRGEELIKRIKNNLVDYYKLDNKYIVYKIR